MAAKNNADNTVNPLTGEGVPENERTAIPNPRQSGTELVQRLSDDALKGIGSFDDAMSLLAETYGIDSVVTASTVLGDGFAMLEDKSSLIGQTMVFVNWSFHMGDHGEFVVARVVTMDNRKLIITDGSTGIHAQLQAYSANSGKYAGLVVKAGLRRSDYTYTDDKGQDKKATTFYLDTSA